MSHWHRPDRTKACITCGETKPLAAFYAYEHTTRQGKRSTRYESRCRPCARDRRKAHYAADPARDNTQAQGWRDANRDRVKAYNRTRQADPAHKANKAKAQRMRKARIRAGEAETDDAIRAIYAEAMRVEALIEASPCPVWDLPELGRTIHVDHVRPLARGGRHTAENLQLLPAGLNMRKGSRHGGSHT